MPSPHRPRFLARVATAATALALLAGSLAPRIAGATPVVAVYREALSADRARLHFSYRTADDAAHFGWERLGVAFYAFASQAPGTVLVYAESPTTAPHARYALSMRTDAEAERAGWGVRCGAFWAYPSARPGTVPVFLETPTTAPHARYNYATRRRDEAAREGWTQLGIAFWVPDPQAVATQAPPPAPAPVLAPMPDERAPVATRAR